MHIFAISYCIIMKNIFFLAHFGSFLTNIDLLEKKYFCMFLSLFLLFLFSFYQIKHILVDINKLIIDVLAEFLLLFK